MEGINMLINSLQLIESWASLVAQMIKNLPNLQESLGWEDPLDKGMATHSSILSGRVSERILAGHSPCGRKKSDPSK